MTLAQLLAAAVQMLNERNCKFAIAGGLAANLYRSELRLTEDIDFGIVAPGLDIEIGRAIWARFDISGKVLTRKQISPAPTYEPQTKWVPSKVHLTCIRFSQDS